MAEVTAADVARRIDVPPATLRRWVRSGLVPPSNGAWTDAAVAQARIVARLPARGHAMSQIRAAAESGQLVYQRLAANTRPRPRIGMYAGAALYRDGDYYGRAVNLAARVAGQADAPS
jgi:class 3 adenylate cyclase